MAHSGRERHRDRDGVRKTDEAAPRPPALRAFRMTGLQRQAIATCLRRIDEARLLLEQQQLPANRQIVRELRASADEIFELLNEFDEVDPVTDVE